MRANLAYRQQPAGEDAAVEPIAIPDEVARLYDELRDCIRANDQEGVRRIFGELVLARRPISEISAVVESLSKAEAKEVPQTSGSSPESAIRHPVAPGSAESASEPAERTADTDPAPDRDTTGAVIAAAEPENDPADENSALDAVSEFQERAPESDNGSPVAAISEPEEDAGPLDQALESDVPYEVEPPISDPATALASVRESLQYAASTADHTKASRPLGASPAAGRRQGLSKAGIGAGIVAVLAMISGGAFWLTHPSPRDVAAGTTLPAPATSTFDAVAPSTAAVQRPRETAATPSRPAPAGAPAAIVVAVPERDPAERPEARPAVAVPERADKANPVSLSASDGPAAAVPAIPPALPSTASADRPVPKSIVPSAEAPEKKTAAAVSAAREEAASAAGPPGGVPAAPVATSADRPQPKPVIASLEAAKNATPTAVPGNGAGSAPPTVTPAAPEAVAPRQPPSTPMETAPLLERGDQLFGVGDIASARLFYERAADAGDGQAALRLGETYDPVFLERAKLRAIKGDRAAAVFWYRRARELGVAEAEILLMGIPTK